MNKTEIVEKTERYVREELYEDSSGHDWWHVARVRRLASAIAQRESADVYIVDLAALLHDISDYKLNGGDHEKGPMVARDWLVKLGESRDVADTVAEIISTLSFKGAGVTCSMSTLEGKVVQDADRLDAIGAIGVARAFAYGGFAGQLMHDPSQKPRLHATKEEYFGRRGTTINHFYEKLLLLRDRMNTETGRRIAAKRHERLNSFLEEFLLEWDALDVD